MRLRRLSSTFCAHAARNIGACIAFLDCTPSVEAVHYSQKVKLALYKGAQLDPGHSPRVEATLLLSLTNVIAAYIRRKQPLRFGAGWKGCTRLISVKHGRECLTCMIDQPSVDRTSLPHLNQVDLEHNHFMQFLKSAAGEYMNKGGGSGGDSASSGSTNDWSSLANLANHMNSADQESSGGGSDLFSTFSSKYAGVAVNYACQSGVWFSTALTCCRITGGGGDLGTAQAKNADPGAVSCLILSACQSVEC